MQFGIQQETNLAVFDRETLTADICQSCFLLSRYQPTERYFQIPSSTLAQKTAQKP